MEAPVTRNSNGDAESPWSARETELLAVTLELLQEHGYDRLTVDAVATTARASKATIYRRWPTKAELVLAAFVEGTRQVAVDPDTGTLRDDLLQLGEQISAHVSTHASTMRDADTLRVETNSEERMDRVLATLMRLDPTMRVVDDSRRPIRDSREAAALAAQLPARETALDPNVPEVAAMLDEFVREYEAKWLDEPIPALDGHTPREAADDPTRRSDLIKLLDSFPAGDDMPGRMSAKRLRSALGLD
jgi:AcrR family transcriptional regulator